ASAHPNMWGPILAGHPTRARIRRTTPGPVWFLGLRGHPQVVCPRRPWPSGCRSEKRSCVRRGDGTERSRLAKNYAHRNRLVTVAGTRSLHSAASGGITFRVTAGEISPYSSARYNLVKWTKTKVTWT